MICAQKSARELVGFLTPNKFYYLSLHRNCEDRHDEFICVVPACMLDTLSYIIWISTCSNYVLCHARLFCVCGSSHQKSHTLKKYRSTMATSRPRPRFAISQRILLVFFIPDKRRSPRKCALMTMC